MLDITNANAKLTNTQKITREISQASTSTTRGHFGCIFTAIAVADCAT
jgi:hypothetical protein